VADYLSGLEFGEASARMADDFPDAKVMALIPEIRPKEDPNGWLMDIVYFLSHGIRPKALSKAQWKQLGVRDCAFNLINESLYHKWAERIWRRVVQTDEQEDVL
jgi:hypothetical protein